MLNKNINLTIFQDKAAKEKFVLGLDIGSVVIKAVTLKFLKDTVELCGFELIKAQSELIPFLKQSVQSHGFNKVNISVCGPSTVIRYVNFPKMNSEELKQALKFEAQKHIPFPANEVNIDAHIVKPDLADNKMLVLMAAAKKELLSQRLKLIEEAGLKINIIDIDSLALINAFNFNYSQEENLKNKTVALLNVGANISSLNILEDGAPRLSRDIQIGGNNFTQKISDILELDFKSAEELKNQADNEKLSKVSNAFEHIFSNLAGEIRVSFDYYESQNASSVIKILLSGGGSLLKGIKETLAAFLGIEVEYWDPFKKIAIAGQIDSQKLKSMSNQLAIAVGLALRSER